MLKLMYITNNPEVALIAQGYGVDRIWVDLEVLGKEDRQKNMNSVKSRHSIEDIKTIAPKLDKAEMIVRVNPWNENSPEEIDQVIRAGADIVMLPMWKTTSEVKAFLECINGRVKVCLLLETKEAEICLDEVLKLSGIDEMHIGLNDLHLSHGLSFMFQLLADGTVEQICQKMQKAGIPFGFGGIAKIGEGLLPAEKIIMEHYRLGSTRAILSRSFCNTGEISDLKEVDRIFRENMKLLREYELYVMNANNSMYCRNRRDVLECIDKIVALIEKKNER